jgi:predicted aldo/keto reductase-like oxidoreductase
MKRRDFIKAVALTGIVSSFDGVLHASTGTVPRRTLGHTGEKVSMVGLGGYHIGNQSDENESIRIIRAALDGGINFLDNCWDYNGGESEVRMGKALRDGYRQKAFLMTKIDGRDAKTANSQLEQSLQRLQTDHIDLLQFHEVIRMNDPERIFADGGGMETAVKARQAGKIRYIGFTGHKSPEIHRHMLEVADRHNFLFDTVQMPLNVMDAHFDSFEKIVLPILVKKNIGVLGMKPMGDKVILRSNTVSALECLQYAMSLPTSVVITGCDSMEIVNQALQVARDFKPLNQSQISTLLAKTETVAKNGQYELYKTSHNFDGTYHNPQWLG